MLQDFVQQLINTINNRINGIHTAFPGTISEFDPGSCTATVSPSIKFRKPNGETLNYPNLSGIPVVFPCSSEATVAYPIKSGDGCLVVVSEESTDYWKYGQETYSDLKFDLTNAICIPGLFNSGNEAIEEAVSENAVVVKVKDTKMRIKDEEILADVKGTELKVKEQEITVDVKGTKFNVKNNEVTIDATDVKIKGNVKIDGTLTY